VLYLATRGSSALPIAVAGSDQTRDEGASVPRISEEYLERSLGDAIRQTLRANLVMGVSLAQVMGL
jgi:hypothetical protein